MAVTAAGGYAPFAEVAASALRARLAAAGMEPTVDDVITVTAAFGGLEPPATCG